MGWRGPIARQRRRKFHSITKKFPPPKSNGAYRNGEKTSTREADSHIPGLPANPLCIKTPLHPYVPS